MSEDSPQERSDSAQERVRTKQLARMGALFAGFAHEIRNPLSTIGLNLQLVKEEFDADDSPRDKRVVRRVTVIENEVQRLQGVLEEFLGFVRIPTLSFSTVRVQPILEELVEFTRPEMKEQGLGLKTFLDPALPPIRADVGQLRAVLVNLVRNAAQATAVGGEILLSAREEPDVAVIQVIDTGEGMSPEVLAKAFDPYFSTKRAGTGLGLPTARRIVEQHGGSIEVASDVGKGTQFTVRIPLATSSQAAMPEGEIDSEVVGDDEA